MARRSFDDYIDNWRVSDASLAKKSRLVVVNTLRRLKPPHACCGHPGEPGC